MPNTPLHTLILSSVPADGSAIGNIALHSLLQHTLPDLTMGEYTTARDELVAQGLLRKGRGRGGAVSLVDVVAAEENGLEVSEVDVWEESEMEQDWALGKDGEQSGAGSGRSGEVDGLRVLHGTQIGQYDHGQAGRTLET